MHIPKSNEILAAAAAAALDPLILPQKNLVKFKGNGMALGGNVYGKEEEIANNGKYDQHSILNVYTINFLYFSPPR